MTFAVAHNIGHRSQETGKPVAKIPAYGESEDLAFRVKAPAVNSCRKIEPVNPHVPHREQMGLHLKSRHDMILFGNFSQEIPRMDMKTIGELVAQERKRQGVTQLQLSQAADTGRRFIVDLEAGKETLHAGKLLKVLETLGFGISLVPPEGA